MRRRAAVGRRGTIARLVAASWEELNTAEQEAAIQVVDQEGERAARAYLGGPDSGEEGLTALCRSRWARDQGDLEGLPDEVLLLYAQAHTVPGDDDYVEQVIERHWPERAWWWWGTEPEDRRADPRVCAFCAAYEQARSALLGLEPPPTTMAELQLRLDQAREAERLRAREWYQALEEFDKTDEYGATRQSAAQLQYEQCQWATNLAEMLLDAAAYLSLAEAERRAHGA